jgi:predicted nucleic acid-binding protein
VLLAAADRSDHDHTACRELLEAHPGPLVTTELVIAETGWLLDRQLGAAAEAALYESAAAGEIRVEPLLAADWTRIAALTVQYADQHLGGVDSSLMRSPSASAQEASTHWTDAISASSARSTSQASSCFRRSDSRSHDCILGWRARIRSPSGMNQPRRTLTGSDGPDYPHPFLVTTWGVGSLAHERAENPGAAGLYGRSSVDSQSTLSSTP